MFQANTSTFVGNDRFAGFRDHITQDGFFFLLEVNGEIPKTHGHALMKDIKRLKDEKGDIRSLGDLEVWINGLSRIKEMPEQFSISCGVQVDDIVYIQTVGTGEVHVRRGDDFVRLIHGDKSASGYIKEGDMFVFTTAAFRGMIEEEEKLAEPMDKDAPPALVSALEEFFDKKDDAGCEGIFAQFSMKAAGAVPVEDSVEDESEKMGFSEVAHTPEYHGRAVESTEVEEELPAAPAGGKKNPFANLKFSLPQSPLSKKTSRILTIAVVAVVAVVFIWSVVFGVQRRRAAEIQKKIEVTEASVDKKTDQADEDAFLNLDRSISLLAEAKKEVADLKKDIGNGYNADISRLSKKISEKEDRIVHKDEAKPEEFYDLSLEEKNAKGTVMYLDKENIAILDPENKTIYNLSAEKKSITTSSNAILAEAVKVGMVKGVLFAFVPDKGLYEFTDDTKVKKVIDADKEWGSIADIAYFAGNVYMLDGGKNDVLKYTLIANGYAPKTSYFNAEPGLEDVRSLKIDSSVYIGSARNIAKFTRGDVDDFKTTFPTSKLDIEAIYTDEAATKVYAWDKTNATIYVMGKNGTFEKQIKSNVLGKATDMIVYKGDILMLAGSKIYKLTEGASKAQ